MTMPAQFPALQQRGLAKFIKLALDFSANETLDPRITFSRTSNATRVNAQGLIEYAPHNLLTNSENFDNAVWGKTSVTVGANIITAPDGTTTADKITYTATSANITQTASSTTATYTISTYVKSSNTSFCRIRVAASTGGSGTSFSSFFNISTGTIAAAGVATADFGSITPNISVAANGFYRISATFTVLSAATSIQYGIIAAQSSGGSGTAGDEIYTWGAQLNVGSLQPYYTTSVKNLLGYSQNFENAAWTKSNSTIDATPVMGPLGFLGAEKLVENTAASVGHYINPTGGLSLVAGQTVTYSVYAKAGERTFVQLIQTGIGPAGANLIAGFDLTNGIAGTPNAGTSLIESKGNGWYRCSFTTPVSASAGSTAQIRLALNSTASPSSYTGDGTSGIYIFGAQLSDSASLDPYSYNFGAAPTSTAYYGPRFDHDPVALAPKGLLIEESRTNLLTYSEQFGNTSQWTVGNQILPFGSGSIANAEIAPDGTTTADKLTVSNISGTHNLNLVSNPAASASTNYTYSVYAKSAGVPYLGLWIFDQTGNTGRASGAINLSTGAATFAGGTTLLISASSIQLPNNWWRLQVSFTTPPTATNIRIVHWLENTNGSGGTWTGDGTSGIYLWGAQLEVGSFPTSYIPTTSAQVTRTADNASMVGTNFSSWYNQSEGTVVVEGDSFCNTTAAFVTIDDGSISNIIQLMASNGITTSTGLQWLISSIIIANTFLSGYNSNSKKGAYAAKTNDYAAYGSGMLITSGTIATMPVVNRLVIGNRSVGGVPLNGHLKSFKFFSNRFINTYLQRLTQ